MKALIILAMAALPLEGCGHKHAIADTAPLIEAVDEYVDANQDYRSPHLRAYGYAFVEAVFASPSDRRSKAMEAQRLETCMMAQYGPKGSRHTDTLRQMVAQNPDGYWRYVETIQRIPAIPPTQETCA